ncbi:restriction endonuclease [Pseudomonas graminis]|uniref:restriction endonuclease n=1 Tax=Pseudomonas graminis TaxID=158627 RepID=UPI0023499695|nr:restriction endonuclease [Pseudomonas graminis]MDC6378856.1 restriction endonuclease [Pseudomonas graminis]
MSFPSDIKQAMRQCILKLLWPKDDIVRFFESNSCTKADIRALGDYKALARAGIVDAMFTHLASRSDSGLGQFRAILQSLISWQHFDDYYFVKLAKLDRQEAERAINHLKQLQEIRDHRIHEQRKEQERRENEDRTATTFLAHLKAQFIALLQGSLTGSKRGYALEGILHELGRLSALEVTEGFRVNGEQIDGAIKFDGEHYLIEAKWQDKAAANEPVYQLATKIGGKMYGRGLFISIHGFSDHVVTSLTAGKALKTNFLSMGAISSSSWRAC